jgi:DNA-directed RNA polymerase specialized sigma24 family protein
MLFFDLHIFIPFFAWLITKFLQFREEKQSNLQEAVNHLPVQQKKICKLHYGQGQSLKDIAKEMKISLSAVQNSINKALKNIRKYFAKKDICEVVFFGFHTSYIQDLYNFLYYR